MNFLKISQFFLLASIFSVVIVTGSTMFPFIVGKAIFFRVMVECALIFYLLHWASLESKKVENNISRAVAFFKKNLIFSATTLFTTIFLLAGFFGTNPAFSFWSNFERGEGGFQMLHYFLFFVLLVLTMKTEKEWRKVFLVSVVAAGLMVSYGIIAILGFKGFIAPSNGFKDRFFGSLGNPDYINTYLIFTFFFIAYLWLTSKTEKYWSWLAPALLIFFGIFFVLGETRGGFVGLAFGILVALIYLIFALKNKFIKIGVSALLFILVLTYAGLYLERDNELVKKLPGSRFLNISLHDASIQPRLMSWSIAWQGALEKPLLGWGPENYSTVYDTHFDTRFYLVGTSSETWFDRAHSVIFDYLAETGFLGLLSYLGIFLAFYYQFFRQKLENFSLRSLLEKSLLFALPLAYLVQGLFLFEVLPMYLNFFLFLAFAHYKLKK